MIKTSASVNDFDIEIIISFWWINRSNIVDQAIGLQIEGKKKIFQKMKKIKLIEMCSFILRVLIELHVE